ncbi:hypothetical protein QUF64_11980 [Anaerolineales bacterium HSG6]|nr:hypothetical protein [Anaerolineales bacterium HSG6]
MQTVKQHQQQDRLNQIQQAQLVAELSSQQEGVLQKITEQLKTIFSTASTQSQAVRINVSTR